ncbi:MAG: DNA translocase FtsK, partial [Clostridia bacterium]|nr:DNA translocase FtsK [Clostridia bacterium]
MATTKNRNTKSGGTRSGKQLNPKTKKAIKNVKAEKAEETQEKIKKPLGFMPYVLVTVAVLLLLLFIMEDTGYLGTILTPLFKGLFGYGAFAIPVYLIIIAVFWKKDRQGNTSAGRYLLCIANFIFVLALVHLHTTKVIEGVVDQRSFSQGEESFIKVFYQNGKDGIGGGVVGGCIGSGIEFLVSTVITYIVSYFVVVITFIFLVGSSPASILRGIKNAAGKAAQARRDREEERAEKARIAAEEEAERKRKEAEAAKAANKKRKPEPRTDPQSEIYNGAPEQENTVMEDPAAEYTTGAQSADHAAAPVTDYESFFNEAEGDAPLVADSTEYTDPAVSSAEYTAEPVTVRSTDPVEQPAADGSADENGEPFDIETVEDEVPATPPYVFPPISLLSEGSSDYLRQDPNHTQLVGQKLVSVLRTYGVKVTLVSTSRGPAVTRYEVLPDEGVRVSRIESLADDIRLRLAASSVRIESNIPGKAAIGIEIPNDTSSVVKLRDLIDNDIFRSNKSKLFVCLGVDVGGNPIYFDIPDMPHLIIAGATGMGKSVCINSIIISLLYRATP